MSESVQFELYIATIVNFNKRTNKYFWHFNTQGKEQIAKRKQVRKQLPFAFVFNKVLKLGAKLHAH